MPLCSPVLRRSLRSTARNTGIRPPWERGCPRIWGQNTSDRRSEAFCSTRRIRAPARQSTGAGGVAPGRGPPRNGDPVRRRSTTGEYHKVGSIPVTGPRMRARRSGNWHFQRALVLPVGFTPLGCASRSCGFGRVHGSSNIPRFQPTIHFAPNVGRSDLRSRSA